MKEVSNIEIDFKPYPIQYKTLEYLWDRQHTQIFFGGAARTSKTYLAVAFATIECLRYEGIQIGLGRSRLTYLKKTTLLTLYEFFKHQNIIEGVHFNHNRQDGIITFNNGSKIILLELYDTPADPNFERLLSLSLTHVIIDEASQVSKQAYDTLSSRISYKLKEYDIVGKILIVSNPCRGWIKEEFYDKHINGTLEDDKIMILGTAMDNPTAGKEYITQQLRILNEPMAQRLIYGNWDYADEDMNVYKYEDIINCFYNIAESDEYYIVADIADKGVDRTVISVWNGLNLIKLFIDDKMLTDQAESKIKKLMNIYKIKVQNIIIDSDGVGVGVSNRLKGCYQFKGGSKALNNENFINLKTQCIIKLKELIEQGKISFNDEYRTLIIRELSIIKYSNIDRDKIQIESKELQKRLNNGMSPDIFDIIMMRMVTLIKKQNKITIR